MYIKKIDLKAFKNYLKNQTDFFLDGNVCRPNHPVEYFRFVRTSAAKGEHNVEILYGGTQLASYLEPGMRKNQLSFYASLDFMAYVVDGETLYSASEVLSELFPEIIADTMDEKIIVSAAEELEKYLDKTLCIEPHDLINPRCERRAYEPAVEEYFSGNSACGTIFYNFPNLLQRFDNIEKIDFLANPTGWSEKYATIKEPLLFDEKTAKFFLCVQRCIKQYIKEFEEHPDCFESRYKALLKAVSGGDTVHVTIKASGQTYHADCPVECIQNYKKFFREGLWVSHVLGSKVKIKKFLTTNYKDYDNLTIPLKLISHIRNDKDGKDTTWTNPFFEEV